MAPDRQQFLDHIRLDGDLLVEAAAAHLDDPAPWCPGWVGRDVLTHTGVVHRHKLMIVRGGLQENVEPPEAPSEDASVIEWYREGLDLMLAALEAADPSTPVYTWYEPDQTVGFWIRRMAHETAIHRADAESTAGPITPLDPGLGADGVDEVLGPIMCAYTDDPKWEFGPDGRWAELRLTDTGDVRTLAFGEGKYGPGWTYDAGASSSPDTVVSATASDLDLWAWGRTDPTVLTIEGDTGLAELIRSTAAEVTG